MATFFSGETTPGDYEQEDNYFTAIRTLAYQLRHSPRTRLDPTIPFARDLLREISSQKGTRVQPRIVGFLKIVKELTEDLLKAHLGD